MQDMILHHGDAFYRDYRITRRTTEVQLICGFGIVTV